MKEITYVEALREAAHNLARLGHDETLGTTVFTDKHETEIRGVAKNGDRGRHEVVAPLHLAEPGDTHKRRRRCR